MSISHCQRTIEANKAVNSEAFSFAALTTNALDRAGVSNHEKLWTNSKRN